MAVSSRLAPARQDKGAASGSSIHCLAVMISIVEGREGDNDSMHEARQP